MHEKQTRLRDKFVKHLRKCTDSKTEEEVKKHGDILHDCSTGARALKEKEKLFGSITTHRLGTKLIEITYDDEKSKEMPPQYMGVYSETLGLPMTYDFEFLMQRYFTIVEWRKVALAELEELKTQARIHIL